MTHDARRMTRIKIQETPLSLDEAYGAVARPECGGVAIFLGTVRSPNEGKPVTRIRYTAHRALAEAELARMAADVPHAYIAHRTGDLAPGEISVIVAVAAPHREEAFAACRRLIEALKKDAPIWKEEFGDGGKRWVSNS